MKPRLDTCPLTDEDFRIWQVNLYGKPPWKVLELWTWYRAADRRDADLMLVAGECQFARFVNSRGDVSMMRLGDDWHAVRRKFDPFYSTHDRDIF